MLKVSNLLSLLIFLLVRIPAINAQKLLNKQQIAMRAPSEVKIDGNPAEWGDKFQAYNRATELYCTLANDNNNLYLIVQPRETALNTKIIDGGITFTIHDKTKVNKDVVITYPIPSALIPAKTKSFERAYNYNIAGESDKAIDSIIFENNRKLTQRTKLIGVEGLTGVDSLVSVYNEDNIKAAAGFNRKMIVTIEIAIPLKYLNHIVDASGKLSYHVQLKGWTSVTINPISTENLDTKLAAAINNFYAFGQRMTAPTDFWGEYILAK